MTILSLKNILADYASLKRKVVDLNICIEKFINGRNNFEKLFGTQKYVFDKHGLYHNHTFSSKYQTHFIKATSFSMPYNVVLSMVNMVIRLIDAL